MVESPADGGPGLRPPQPASTGVVGRRPGARLGIVCAGKTYFDVVQAFADLGVGLETCRGSASGSSSWA